MVENVVIHLSSNYYVNDLTTILERAFSKGGLKRVQNFIQHAKSAILDEMLDIFKDGSFIQHFIKEEKNHVGWCWMKFVPEQIFHPPKMHDVFV